MQRLCVFCGSSSGVHKEYAEAAAHLGKIIAESGIGLVTGGGQVGLMGVVSDAALAAGGAVIGVIPEKLVTREIAHNGLTELKIVKSMHERKAIMADLVDGFIAMPGGFGTLEEFCEVITWSQLGFHKKPVGLLNVHGFFDEFIFFLDKIVKLGFAQQVHRDLVLVSNDAADIVTKVTTFKHTAPDKWGLTSSER